MKPSNTIAAALFAGALGLLAGAPAAAQAVPSYAQGTTDETVQGTVSAINGRPLFNHRPQRSRVCR
jgi:hypothetical protein